MQPTQLRRAADTEPYTWKAGEARMPIISRFFGIAIFMLWREHAPPHFHAKYGDDEVVVEIETGAVNGRMSRRALSLVQEWRELHKRELLENWKLVEQKKPLKRIEPLE